MTNLKSFLKQSERAGLFLTPFTIAKETGIAKSDIDNYINGDSLPSDSDVTRLQDYMDRIIDLIEHERFINYVNSHQFGGC